MVNSGEGELGAGDGKEPCFLHIPQYSELFPSYMYFYFLNLNNQLIIILRLAG